MYMSVELSGLMVQLQEKQLHVSLRYMRIQLSMENVNSVSGYLKLCAL